MPSYHKHQSTHKSSCHCEVRQVLPPQLKVCEDEPVSLTVETNIWPQPCIQWQISTDNGGTWKDLRGENNPSLNFTARRTQDENLYRALVQTNCECWVTNPTQLKIRFSEGTCSRPGETVTFTISGQSNKCDCPDSVCSGKCDSVKGQPIAFGQPFGSTRIRQAPPELWYAWAQCVTKSWTLVSYSPGTTGAFAEFLPPAFRPLFGLPSDYQLAPPLICLTRTATLSPGANKFLQLEVKGTEGIRSCLGIETECGTDFLLGNFESPGQPTSAKLFRLSISHSDNEPNLEQILQLSGFNTLRNIDRYTDDCRDILFLGPGLDSIIFTPSIQPPAVIFWTETRKALYSSDLSSHLIELPIRVQVGDTVEQVRGTVWSLKVIDNWLFACVPHVTAAADKLSGFRARAGIYYVNLNNLSRCDPAPLWCALASPFNNGSYNVGFGLDSISFVQFESAKCSDQIFIYSLSDFLYQLIAALQRLLATLPNAAALPTALGALQLSDGAQLGARLTALIPSMMALPLADQMVLLTALQGPTPNAAILSPSLQTLFQQAFPVIELLRNAARNLDIQGAYVFRLKKPVRSCNRIRPPVDVVIGNQLSGLGFVPNPGPGYGTFTNVYFWDSTSSDSSVFLGSLDIRGVTYNLLVSLISIFVPLPALGPLLRALPEVIKIVIVEFLFNPDFNLADTLDTLDAKALYFDVLATKTGDAWTVITRDGLGSTDDGLRNIDYVCNKNGCFLLIGSTNYNLRNGSASTYLVPSGNNS